MHSSERGARHCFDRILEGITSAPLSNRQPICNNRRKIKQLKVMERQGATGASLGRGPVAGVRGAGKADRTGRSDAVADGVRYSRRGPEPRSSACCQRRKAERARAIPGRLSFIRMLPCGRNSMGCHASRASRAAVSRIQPATPGRWLSCRAARKRQL